MTVEEHLHRCIKAKVDISGHLLTLRRYALKLNYVVELGVRGIVSTWALLSARPRIMVSVDIRKPSRWGADIREVERLAKAAGVKYRFILGNDLTILLRGPFDLVFIDTWHVYEQLKQELAIYAPKTRRYLIMHDTVTFGERGESRGRRGLRPAISEFLSGNEGKHWKIEREDKHSHGLTVLKRI